MPLNTSIQCSVVATLCLLLTACSQSTPDNPPSADQDASSFALQPNNDVEAILLSGVFSGAGEWTLDLATPLLQRPQQTAADRYTIRINDTAEQIAVSVSEISKGPAHFSAVVDQQHLPIRRLTLFDNNVLLATLENDQLLPSADDWLSQVQLAPQNGELCLTWPEELFAQAGLLSVGADGRLQLRQQSFTSPLCTDFEAAADVEWRVNLRNPMFAVQLLTKP